jgi:hypothetical protein
MQEVKTTADRLAAFSDAVFAVIVIIMVLELKVPDVSRFSALSPLWSPPADRQGLIRSVRFDLGHRLKSVKFVPLNHGEKLEYSKRGVVFRPSLPPVARLIATYEGSGPLQRLTTSYLVGVQGEHYYITLASPASQH